MDKELSLYELLDHQTCRKFSVSITYHRAIDVYSTVLCLRFFLKKK